MSKYRSLIMVQHDFTSAEAFSYLYKHHSGKSTNLIPGLPLGSMKKQILIYILLNLDSNDALVLISDGLPECLRR